MTNSPGNAFCQQTMFLPWRLLDICGAWGDLQRSSVGGGGGMGFSVSLCLFLTCKSNEHHIATLVSQYYIKVLVLAPVVAQFPEVKKCRHKTFPTLVHHRS